MGCVYSALQEISVKTGIFKMQEPVNLFEPEIFREFLAKTLNEIGSLQKGSRSFFIILALDPTSNLYYN